MPDEAPAPAAPAAPAAPSTPEASPSSSGAPGPDGQRTDGLPPSADHSILGQQTAPPSEGGFRYVGDDGNFVPEWSKHLPEDMGDFRSKLANYRNPVDLAKALHSANQTIGKKGIIPPTKDSSAEEVSAYRKAMGVPETPKGYLEKLPATPEGVTFDEGIAATYMEVAHQFNIPAEAMAKLVEVNMKQAEIQNRVYSQELSQVRENGRQQLRQLWGRDFDRKIGLVERAVHFAEGNPNTYGFRDPEVIRIVASLASRLSEDNLVGTGPALPAGVHEMKAQAVDIISNPQNKDYQKYRAGDPDVRSRVRRMLEAAEPPNIKR